MYKIVSLPRDTTSFPAHTFFKLLFSSLFHLWSLSPSVPHRRPLFRQLSVHPLRNLLLHSDPLWQLIRKPIYCQSRYVVRLADCISARLFNMCKSFPPFSSSNHRPSGLFFLSCLLLPQHAERMPIRFDSPIFSINRLRPDLPCRSRVLTNPHFASDILVFFFSFMRIAHKTRRLLLYDIFFFFPVTSKIAK